jgi:hypothetical protein
MENSCSDHNIIKFNIGQDNNYGIKYNYTGTRYLTTEEHYTRFDYNLLEAILKEYRMEFKDEFETLDNILAKHIKEVDDRNYSRKITDCHKNGCKK